MKCAQCLVSNRRIDTVFPPQRFYSLPPRNVSLLFESATNRPSTSPRPIHGLGSKSIWIASLNSLSHMVVYGLDQPNKYWRAFICLSSFGSSGFATVRISLLTQHSGTISSHLTRAFLPLSHTHHLTTPRLCLFSGAVWCGCCCTPARHAPWPTNPTASPPSHSP